MQAHTHDVELAIVQHSRRPPPTGIWRAAKHIYLHEGGLPGLYRGVWPTTVRAAILTASQLPGAHHTWGSMPGQNLCMRARCNCKPLGQTPGPARA